LKQDGKLVDTRDQIMATARAVAQAHGYNGLSFRELAKAVGIKSASIHYHFPTKGDLGAALARRYRQDATTDLNGLLAEGLDPVACLVKYVAAFRVALERDNRMCLCGIMAAEHDDLPDAVKDEVTGFADDNVAWLCKVLSLLDPLRSDEEVKRHAFAIYAAMGGAQLTARGRGDIALYDDIVETYRLTGLIPT
jgi:TetR/AcrR family transcriptional repressor of nem operon